MLDAGECGRVRIGGMVSIRLDSTPSGTFADFDLGNSLRLVPHDQNTGGFFVCVLERKGSPSEAMVAIKEA